VTPQHFDVLVIGAGISGIDAAYRLQTECPDRSFAVLEARADLGGTWDLFRFPGIRSDSDMYTLGFPFRPWTGSKSIADGASILQYLHDTVSEYGIDRSIRFNHRVTTAAWSSGTSTWTVDVQVEGASEPTTFTADFLYACSGYYRYDHGYTPDFPGVDRFAGQVVHPQEWPEDLDYRDRRVVIIGSGATAVTMVPAIAADAAHVTMLQRSPSYIVDVSSRDAGADRIHARLPKRLADLVVRWKNALVAVAFFQFARRAPKLTRKALTAGVARLLPPDIPVDPHFSPSYDPWDQRVCFVPDGDLFAALRAGKADVVTERIDTFTETGIRLESGAELAADIVVTATGLELLAIGGIALVVDGEKIDPGATYMYRGFMLSGVPNFAFALGYTNASWTLRVDLSAKSVCKLLNHMRDRRFAKAVPIVDESTLPPKPFFDLDAGYIRRGADRLPKQSTKRPWNLRQNYVLDALDERFGDITEAMTFTRAGISAD
jgi:cation diffusion facilitator CzcD-associated flavoprotein CzcO